MPLPRNAFKGLIIVCLGAMSAASGISEDADPPRRAARLGYVGGSVSLTPAGLQDATPAEVNRAFTTGDRFWSGADGRGELQTDNAAIRFGGRASFVIQELSNQATLIGLESGTLSVRLHALAPLEAFEIETPQFTFHLKRLGAYRVDVDEKGGVVIAAVRLGDAEMFGSDGRPTSIPRGRQARAAAAGSPTIEPVRPMDEFEAWCVERDRREDLSVSAQYVSRDVPGYADLDDHGTWRSVDPHGMAWFPSNMDPDWAPYRSGHFVSVGLWGMNWVDAASWGFGPLHYGRWLKVNGAWGWIPGEAGKSTRAGAPATFAIRPYYSPALVAWTRFAAGVLRPSAVVGWFPLGPGEAWVPQSPVSADYLARVNLSNTVIADPAALDKPDVTRVNYVNQETAMTAVGQDDLAAGRPVGREYVRVPQTAYAEGMVTAYPGVEITKEARLGPRGPAQGAPPEIANRSVVVHRVPAPQSLPYARQEPTPQTSPAASPQPAAGSVFGPKAGSPAVPDRSVAKPVSAAPAQPAALSTPKPQKGSPAVVAHPGAKPVSPAPVEHPGGIGGALSNASKGVVNGVRGAAKGTAGAVKGVTTKTNKGTQPKPQPPTPPGTAPQPVQR